MTDPAPAAAAAAPAAGPLRATVRCPLCGTVERALRPDLALDCPGNARGVCVGEVKSVADPERGAAPPA